MPYIHPGGGQGRREDSGRRSIRSLSHPPTPPWEPGRTSHAKVVLLNEPSVPEVRGCPKKENTSLQWVWGWPSSCTCQDQEGGKGEGASSLGPQPACQADINMFCFSFPKART